MLGRGPLEKVLFHYKPLCGCFRKISVWEIIPNWILCCQRGASQDAHSAPSDAGIGEITTVCLHPVQPLGPRVALPSCVSLGRYAAFWQRSDNAALGFPDGRNRRESDEETKPPRDSCYACVSCGPCGRILKLLASMMNLEKYANKNPAMLINFQW